MSYTTWVNLQLIKNKGNKEKAIQAFKKIVEEADPCFLEFDEKQGTAAFEDNNENALEEITEATSRYPDMLIDGDVDGTSEDFNDRRVIRIQNGKMEIHYGTVTYAPFEVLLTQEERKAAKWNGSPRGRRHAARRNYDHRVIQALRLLAQANPGADNPDSNETTRIRIVDAVKTAIQQLETAKRLMY